MFEELADNLPKRQVDSCRAGWRILWPDGLLHHAVLPAIAKGDMHLSFSINADAYEARPVRLTSIAASSRSSQEANRH